MTRVSDPASWVAKVVTWANLVLFSLNVAWMTVWYVFQQTSLFNNWPLQGDVPVVFHWYFWMPEPGAVLRQVVYSFVLCVPLALALLPLARVSRVSVLLRAIAGGFAVTGFPLLALWFNDEFLNPEHYLDHMLWLIPETVAVLACGVLYYLRKWPLPPAASVLLLLLHFGLWAWLTGNYVSPFRLASAFPHWFRMSALQVGLRVCIMMMYHNGFPVIGFLSAISAALDLKLSSGRAPRAAAPNGGG